MGINLSGLCDASFQVTGKGDEMTAMLSLSP